MSGITPALISSSLYAARNWDKTMHAKTSLEAAPALGVVIGQGKKALSEASKLEGKIGKNANRAVVAIQGSKVAGTKFGKVAKTSVNWASKNINPLLCVLEGVRVLNDEDKSSAAIEGTAALTTMFKAESIVKKNMDQIAKSLKIKGKYANLAKGVIMFLTSFFSYSVGKEGGKLITGRG